MKTPAPIDSGFPLPRGMVLTIGPVFWLAFILLRAFPRVTAVAYTGVVRLTAAGAAPEWPSLLAAAPVSRLTPFPDGNGRTQGRDITRMRKGVPVLLSPMSASGNRARPRILKDRQMFLELNIYSTARH
jgi:hypothetical protein